MAKDDVLLRTENKTRYVEAAAKAGSPSLNQWLDQSAMLVAQLIELVGPYADAAQVSPFEYIKDACEAQIAGGVLKEQFAADAERDRLTMMLLAQTTAMVQQLAERADVDFAAVDDEVIATLQDAGFDVEPQGEAV